MRTVEQVVAEIDAAIAGTGPLSAHAWAPGREPALELLARLGATCCGGCRITTHTFTLRLSDMAHDR